MLYCRFVVSDLVVLGLPVLKRRSLGRGDPKLSLLRLWGQSSCFFNFFESYVTSSVLELRSSSYLYATKSSPKDASSLVSLAGDNHISDRGSVETLKHGIGLS